MWTLPFIILTLRPSNRRRLLNKSSLTFHIMILINFHVNIGIAVIFDFFFRQHFQKKKTDLEIKPRPTTIL